MTILEQRAEVRVRDLVNVRKPNVQNLKMEL